MVLSKKIREKSPKLVHEYYRVFEGFEEGKISPVKGDSYYDYRTTAVPETEFSEKELCWVNLREEEPRELSH